ncbi:probable E3 ubiquitin-protein ligase MID2 [Ostrea edulis]|uniref:probable E3 ubiquitin-protein ligase MID2 n=1 Tax=Ostrea edulis TaxID=37623 RepID=UPI0024AF9502|nr:probable E3 ubiquitin-protein ligase MID2 [Ostrea edulis]
MAEYQTRPPGANPVGDTFRCPICLEEVRNPKYLSCFHTFCETCIQTYISSTAARKDNETLKTIECPVCRKRIEAPNNDITSEEWALALPPNKLIASMSVDPKKEEHKFCMFCKRNNKSVTAEHWCKSCMESICDDCKCFHSCVPSLRDHKIISLSDALGLKNDIEVDEPCSVHKGKLLEVYCTDHDKLCCSICFATKHRKCEQVQAIEDVAAEMDEDRVQHKLTLFNDLLESLENLQEEYSDKVTTLNSRKQEIVSSAEKKVEEIKSQIDKAHAQWLKIFEQKHREFVGNIEVASDEIKRLATTVRDAKTLLQTVQENGSTKQIFVTNHKLGVQVLEHLDRLRALNIWDFVQDYNHQNTDFLLQICNDGSFQNVSCSEMRSTALQKISTFVSLMSDKTDIARRRKVMCRKDWMKVNFEKISEMNLSTRVYYGLFVSDTKVIMSIENPRSLKVYDVSDAVGECVHTHSCQATPYGLCQSGDCMDIVYVSFRDHVDYYHIKVAGSVTFIKLGTFQLKEPMLAISYGTATVSSANDSKRMICSSDFSDINHSSSFSKHGAAAAFVSTSRSDRHCFVRESELVVVDQNNTEIFQSSVTGGSRRGLTFDLQDNILICLMNSKIKQIRNGGTESRDINLPGIQKSYNVVLHPTGEKMLVLDFNSKCCVYKVS